MFNCRAARPLSDFMRRTLIVVASTCAGLFTAPVAADAYPHKPIVLVVPFPPGGSADAMMRTLAAAASTELGQPVVLMHRAGNGGVIGPASVAQSAAPDGYTLAMMHNAVIRQPLLQKVNWDPLTDFTYVIGLADFSTVVAVRSEAPWKTLQELLADAKARPGAISYGNVGATSANRIAGEQLGRLAGAQFNMVPFKGGSEAVVALLGGHLDVYGDPGVGPTALSGKIRLLASLTDNRLGRFPKVPTTRELGYNLAVYSPIGIVGPKGMNPAVVAKLHAAFRTASKNVAYNQVLDDYDLAPHLMTDDEYRKYAVEQFAREKIQLQQLGFKLE